MRLIVNGETREVDLAGHETLASVLRDQLELTGTKISCGRGECGACTVLLRRPGAEEARSVYACLTLAAGCDDADVTTIEGVGGTTPHPLQRAFIAHDAVQCGYCTPGQIMAACALLARNDDPDEHEARRALSGNLCRCGTQPNVVAAVLDAAKEMRGGR